MPDDNAILESPELESAEPYQPHITAEDLAWHERRVAARRGSNMNPTPGPLCLAFAPVPLVVAGVALHPVTVAHFICLQWIGSPLLALINGEEAAMSEEQVIEALFLLSSSPRAARQALARGHAAFNVAALDALSDSIKMADVANAGVELVGVLNGCFATFIKHGAEKSEDGGAGVSSMSFEGGEEDGLGWMLGLVSSVAREYGWSLSFVMDELPVAQAVAFDMWARENSPWGGVVRESNGYIAQELEARLVKG